LGLGLGLGLGVMVRVRVRVIHNKQCGSKIAKLKNDLKRWISISIRQIS
jgi:hypothetical protein